jgi:hypothetical protein
MGVGGSTGSVAGAPLPPHDIAAASSKGVSNIERARFMGGHHSSATATTGITFFVDARGHVGAACVRRGETPRVPQLRRGRSCETLGGQLRFARSLGGASSSGHHRAA